MLKKFILVALAMLMILSGISSSNSFNLQDSNKIYSFSGNEDNNVKSDFPATGFIYVDQDENGVWWFINSTGEKFYAEAVAYVTLSPFFYGNISTWVDQTDRLLQKMGVNTISTGSESYLSGYYYKARFRFKQLSITHDSSWLHNRIPDVFDPWWQGQVKNVTQKYATALKDDPLLLGYYTDNEMKWGPDTLDNLTLLEVYMSAENSTTGKQELIKFLKEEQYSNDIDLFNRVWNMNITSFKDLENHEKFGVREAWRLRTSFVFEKRKLFGIYPKYRENFSLMEKAEKDVRNFSRYVAKTYFNVTNSCLKAADPNHLNIGTRFHLFGAPIEVLEECGNYVDVISINYYRANIHMYDPLNHYTSLLYGCVPLTNWMQSYNGKTGRPLFISESNMKRKDRMFPVMTEDNRFSARITQKNRADNVEWYAKNCLQNPYMVGNTWFTFRNTGFGHGIYKGIVDLFGQRDQELIDPIKEIYPNSTSLHEKASSNVKNLDADILEGFFENNAINIEDLKTNNLLSDSGFSTLSEAYDENIQKDRVYTKLDVEQGGKTIYVDDDSNGPGDGSNEWPYCKISYAIDNATGGDVIRVFNGVYKEKITVDKPLHIVGNGSSTTCISGYYEDSLFIGPGQEELNNHVITISSDDVKIQGFNLTTAGIYMGSSGGLRGCHGIHIFNATNCEIVDNIFDILIRKGLTAKKCKNIKIRYNDFTNNDVTLDSSDNAIVYDNAMGSIWISRSRNCTVKNNLVSNSKFGITLAYADNNLLEGNTVEKCKSRGVFLKNSNNNIIKENNFLGFENPIKNLLSSFNKYKETVYYESATFLNSKDNKWIGNYWDRGKILPKLIVGRSGSEGLIPVFNIDWHPAKTRY